MIFGPPHWPWLGAYWSSLSVSALALSTLITFMVKVAVLIFIFMWVRATLPRLRYDQLMRFGWKFLLPVGLALVFITSALMIAIPHNGPEQQGSVDTTAVTQTQEVPNG